jgi:methyl-accepting chemotaxis protein
MKNICDSGDLIKSHAKWKMKLAIAVANKEKLDIGTISDDGRCTVGKWLHKKETYSKFKHLPSFLDCTAKHMEFHIEAGKVATLVNAKRYDDALQLLDSNTSDFNRASDDVTLSITNFLQELDSSGIAH